MLPKFNKNQEKDKKVKRERRGISTTLLPKFLSKFLPVLKKNNYSNAIAEIEKKKICFDNCGNGIAENLKKKKKKFILTIVTMPLPKI